MLKILEMIIYGRTLNHLEANKVIMLEQQDFFAKTLLSDQLNKLPVRSNK